ncbi:hypothetical protein LTR22_028130 [Elasticomyces elasticus]|nr:hypothetical protein LTR22_028130 [Elasticomyces elasticus]
MGSDICIAVSPYDNKPSLKNHAILVGIDAYPDEPLKSCVRDVEKIKECLEEKVVSINIQTLTAHSLESKTIDESQRPTYRGVASALENTTLQASRGDFVYIHYSGHGTRLPPCFDFSNRSTGDLALVLLEGGQSKEIYLRGPRLAGYLRAMVEKGLIVTLVLDCCFSATVYRNSDTEVRYLPSDPTAAPTYQMDLDTGIPDTSFRSENRDASMRDNWLLDPDQYVILAACGPNENAKVTMDSEGDTGISTNVCVPDFDNRVWSSILSCTEIQTKVFLVLLTRAGM